MAHVLGLNAKMYYKVTPGSQADIELTNVRNVTLNLEKGEADITTRASNGWRSTAATLKSGTVEFEMVWDDADAGFTAIKNAYFNDAAIALAVFDGAAGQGLDADFVISNFSRTENLEEALMVSVTAKPTYITRAPSWQN